MPGGALSKREKQKAAAYAIVAMDLASMREDVSVGPEDIGDVDAIKEADDE